MPRAGPRKVQRYSLEFRRKAVALSQVPDVEVQAVADALESHPFMLSRWRKQAREGTLRGSAALPAKVTKTLPARPGTRDVRGSAAVPAVRGHASGVLCVAAATGQCAREAGPRTARRDACELRAE